MNVKQSLTMALKSLMSSKMRSFLTMLGIIIGVAAVIVIVSVINGVTSDVLENFESLGATNITVSIRGRGGNRSVDVDDMQNLVDENPTLLKSMSPSVTVSGASIKSGSETLDTTSIKGVGEYYDDVATVDVEYGRGVTYADCEYRLSNCIVGSYVAKEFFGTSENALGNEIKINGIPFNIVGVYKEQANSKESSTDDAIVIPYTVAKKISGNGNVNTFTFCALNKDVAQMAQQKIEQYLYGVFSSTDAYTVINMSSIIDTINEVTGTMSVMGAVVAGISLLVGGIGIMNIMLVSVTERTREIGVRKSLGASPWDIMSQFVVEAITTSSIGGILGIIFGAVACYIITFLDIKTKLSIPAVFISFTVSALIGVAFGYFPAKKAAALNPIEALRHD